MIGWAKAERHSRDHGQTRDAVVDDLDRCTDVPARGRHRVKNGCWTRGAGDDKKNVLFAGEHSCRSPVRDGSRDWRERVVEGFGRGKDVLVEERVVPHDFSGRGGEEAFGELVRVAGDFSHY